MTRRPFRRSWSARPTPGAPVGPGKDIAYTITVNNIGNADATGVTVTDPIPANTSFKSAGGRRRPQRRQGHLDGSDRRRR